MGRVSRLGVALLGGSVLAGMPGLALAAAATGQTATHAAAPVAAAPAPAAPASPPAPAVLIQSISVEGAQRLEPETVLSYTQLRSGQPYTEANSWPDNPPTIEYDEGLQDAFEEKVVTKSVPYTKTVYNKKTKTTTAVAGWKQVKEVRNVQVQWARDPELVHV